jgi:hypothetical protein
MARFRGAVAVALLALLLPACARSAPPPGAGGSALVEATPTLADEDTVELTVYLRSGSGPEAFLVPALRTAPVGEDLPRVALELLLDGPVPADGAGVHAPLPTTTTVRAFAVQGDTAVVDLSREAITDAASVGASAEHELLALAAVADTLTDFPAIDWVRLTVDGAGERFWGAWGLPPVLTRDETLIGKPHEGELLPSPARFVLTEQRVGVAGAAPVRVRSVRTIDRLAFLRVVIELAGDGDAPAVAVPPARAWAEGGRLLLEIDDTLESAAGMAPGQRLRLDGMPFQTLEAADGELPGPLRLAVAPGDGHPFWLHTLTSPTRVVLDVRK